VFDGSRLDAAMTWSADAQYGVVAESSEDLWPGFVRKACVLLSLLDHCREIPAVNVFDVWPLHQPPGEEAVLVVVGRTLDAIGVEDDGAGKILEFRVLVLPGAAEVAGKWNTSSGRDSRGREHFAVGVDVDAGPSVCFEQFFQKLQVVAGDQDRLAGLGAEIDLGRHRVAVGLDMAWLRSSMVTGLMRPVSMAMPT